MDKTIWICCTVMAIVLWSTTSLLYKAGIYRENEKFVCLKYTVSVGVVFFIIALGYFLTRHESFSIWESAIRYWPVTIFGFVYAVINTISFNGYIYNEAAVESPVEGISGGTSTILLMMVYLMLGRVDSFWTLMVPLRTAGILIIMTSVLVLSNIRNKEEKRRAKNQMDASKSSWKWRGLGTLIFPVLFSVADGMETVVTGICLDTTYGYAMPERDSIIIVGFEYAFVAFGCWFYINLMEKEIYNPFKRENRKRILGALTDNVGIVFYSYAMAIDSISTDPILAVYPVVTMLGSYIFLKEKISIRQYICLAGIILGSILIVVNMAL